MSDRFSDDKFIEAAKAYQNIKAPSDLRERILMEAARYEETPGEAASAEKKRNRKSAGKIYRALSLAACLAIMVSVLPDWMPGEPAEDLSGPMARSVSSETMVPEEPGEEPAEGLPEPETDGAQESVPAQDLPETGIQSETAAAPGEGDAEPADAEPAAEYRARTAEADEEKGPLNKDGETAESEEPEEKESEVPSVSLSALLPTIATEGSPLENMKVRLIDAEDGSCTVEIITADAESREITVSKNTEDGHWQITGAPEEENIE